MEGGSARLFVALELPAEVRETLVAWRAPLLASEETLRPVAPEALHLTLCFLGQTPVEQIEPLGAVVAAVAAAWTEVGGLELGGPVWLPRRRPHALALALRDPRGELAALQGELAGALTAGGWLRDEERPYVPHMTVARVRRGGGRGGGGAEGSRALARRALAAPPAQTFAGAAVALYRSHLGAGGARYEAIVRQSLRRPA
jgi:RNA 2',3'-cyclic 3'-phosphodiesterase